jgi:hypothetical protein
VRKRLDLERLKVVPVALVVIVDEKKGKNLKRIHFQFEMNVENGYPCLGF